jgi:hypothetical protein
MKEWAENRDGNSIRIDDKVCIDKMSQQMVEQGRSCCAKHSLEE